LTYPGETDGAKGRVLYRGAEADIVRGSWCGLPAVYKVRKELAYRLPELDTAIRRQRTIHEAELIHSAKEAGVSAPVLYYVDAPMTTLVMEFVEGERLKEFVSFETVKDDGRYFEEL